MFGNNLKYYRLKKGLTKKDLAEKCGISAMSLTYYESNQRQPNFDVVSKLSKALDIGIADFMTGDYSNLQFKHAEFRKTNDVSKTDQEYIKSSVEEYFSRFFNAVECVGGNPLQKPVSIHQLDYSGDAEQDALALRNYLGFPDAGPVHNLIAVLENKGIMVFTLNIKNEHFSGINGCVNEYPYILINENMTYERQRSTICHELVHMFFVKDTSMTEKDVEKYATSVSGAFLISKNDLERELGIRRSAVTNDMEIVCEEYGVSMMLLVTRAKLCGIISDSTAKDFYIFAGKIGWRKKEPSRFKYKEEPTLFKQLVYRAVNENDISYQKAVELLNIPYNQVVNECKVYTLKDKV